MATTHDAHVSTFLWTIENLSFFDPEIHTKELVSPFFVAGSPAETMWCFRLFPKGKKEQDKHFRFELNLCSAPFRFPVDVEVSILGSDGQPLATEIEGNRLTYGLLPLVMPKCPTHEEMFVTQKSTFLPNDTLTLRSHMWRHDGSSEHSTCVDIRSQIEVFKDSFEWHIKGFDRLPLRKEVSVREYVSIASGIMLLQFHFSLTGGSLEKAVAKLEITSNLINRDVSATLKVSVLDKEQKVVRSIVEKRMFRISKKHQSWVLPQLATRAELLLASRSNCLSGDVLTLRCEFVTVGANLSHFTKRTDCGPFDLTTDVTRNDFICTDSSCQTDVARNDSICSDASCTSWISLGEDWLSLYRDQTGSDFELRSGDVSFPVHKQVLMARSPVFRRMFCSDMRESGTHSLDVPDVDAQTLDRMLTFLYAGSVDPDLQWEDAAKLYKATDKYQVQSLKRQCSSVLQSGLSVSNVVDLLSLAEEHADKTLESFVHDFILRRFDEVVLSDEWKQLMRRDAFLAGNTMQDVYEKKMRNQ